MLPDDLNEDSDSFDNKIQKFIKYKKSIKSLNSVNFGKISLEVC